MFELLLAERPRKPLVADIVAKVPGGVLPADVLNSESLNYLPKKAKLPATTASTR